MDLKHYRTKISLEFTGAANINVDLHDGKLYVDGTLGEVSTAWSNLTDTQRLEMIKSLIWTSPNMHDFHAKVEKVITSNKFKETFD